MTGLKIYQYDFDDILAFGKYTGLTVREVLHDHPYYLEWLIHYVNWFEVEEKVWDELMEIVSTPEEDPAFRG